MKPNIIKNERVRIEAGRRPGSSPSGGGRVHGPKSVRLLEENGAQAIEFTCSCGEVTVIEIQTEGSAGSAQQV